MKYLLTILCILFLACHSSNNGDKNNLDPNYYFDFDEIEYYNSTYRQSDFVDVLKNGHRSLTDSIKRGVLLFNTPKSLSDTLFLLKLDEIGYKKKSIDTSKYGDIKEIFKKKVAKNHLSTTCDPMHQNILIFRNKHKVVGIAKICFGCMSHQIVGAKKNTDDFGQDGDYEKLKNILFR